MDNLANLLPFFDGGLDMNVILNAAMELAEPPHLEPNVPDEHVRNENYFELTMPNYSLDEYQSHFRMNRVTMEEVTNAVGRQLNHERHLIPLPKKVAFTTWMLAKSESFLSAGDRFGFAKSSAHDIFCEVTTALSQMIDMYIVWPNEVKRDEITRVFEEKSGIPGVVGTIDGCHIVVKQPEGNAVDFYNRKMSNSVILQGVCDHNRKFTNIFVGMPGRVHDARVLRNSPLHERLRNNLLPPNQHLIGDAAYPLSQYILPPFKNNGHLTPEKINYNIKLSSIRSIIERAFGLLKCKFRRLKYLDVADPMSANRIIAACCVLHNIILEREGLEADGGGGDDDDDAVEIHDMDDDVADNGHDDFRERGENKRNYIVTLLQQL